MSWLPVTGGTGPVNWPRKKPCLSLSETWTMMPPPSSWWTATCNGKACSPVKEHYFNFVGRFVPPAFGEAELTPEELEERRKKEERKDRLHQNYLKRKASGKHQAYENKIKDKRKADIDAKKAAIRAEDIAKGVFVPVCNLPRAEPKVAKPKGA